MLLYAAGAWWCCKTIINSMQHYFGIIIKAFYSSFFISWLKEKKISLKEVKEEAKTLKAFLICKKPICKNFQVK